MTAPASTLLVFYLLLATGCLLVGWRRVGGPGDRVLLFLFWPLMAPLLLRPETAPPDRCEQKMDPSGPAATLLAALERVADSPLRPLLPDPPTVHRLARHLDRVSARVDELDEVLARPAFDLEAAAARRSELEVAGASVELVAGAAMRHQGLERLRALRARLARELEEVSELMSQLVIQVELVRFAGVEEGDPRTILGELLGRVDGLTEMLDDRTGAAPARL